MTDTTMPEEKVSMLFAGDSPLEEYLEQFDASPDWAVHPASDLDTVFERAKQLNPDLVMLVFYKTPLEDIADLVSANRKLKKGRPFVLFITLADDPGADRYRLLLESGCDDIFIHPVCADRIRHRARVHIRKNDLLIQCRFEHRRAAEADTRLSWMKKELNSLKKNLYDEKDALNSALKQIGQMTKERNRLRKDLTAVKQKYQQTVTGIREILGRMISSRVETNRGHAERVAKICDFVAQSLDVPDKDRRSLATAARLHEAGLLLVPGTVRSDDPDNLSLLEKDLLLQSPVKGAQLLEQCPGYSSVADIIRYMNENVDGSGVPEGLKKKMIPLLSRILAGADMLDSLLDTLSSPGQDEVMHQLEQSAGQRLDPVIVNCLEKYIIMHQQADDTRTKGVGISELKPGMCLAAGLFTSTGTKLFSVNTLLNEAAIDRIIRYNREYPVEETVYIKA